jgi:hypothetical protein
VRHKQFDYVLQLELMRADKPVKKKASVNICVVRSPGAGAKVRSVTMMMKISTMTSMTICPATFALANLLSC